jgi:4-diphosphocytidyl-2-C-methyl-D-erythritol kinase
VLAPAKINLWLEVLRRRADGYHDIETWMLALDLCDVVEARANGRGDVQLEVTGACASADIPRDGTNLCVRAAAAALDAAREARRAARSSGVELRLTKNIPSQAGLGGASADAAAAWLAVESALKVELPPSSAERALASLGSDCVFFLKAASSGSAWCEGRGERVAALDGHAPEWFVALLTPAVRCPTATVYGALGKPLSASRELHSLPATWLDMPAHALRRRLFNRLEVVALEATPALAAWRDTLDACGAEHFRLSGSGSSFYGLFDARDDAEQALDRVFEAAARRGLEARGRWIARPAGHGARVMGPKISRDG